MKRNSDEKGLLNIKKQSLIFNSNQQLKLKNASLNLKNINMLEKKVLRNSKEQGEEKVELLIMVKQNKENDVSVQVRKNKVRPQLNKSYEPLSTRKKQKIKLNF